MAANLDQADFPYVPQGNPTKETLKNTEIKIIQGIKKRMARFQKLTRNLFLTLHGHNVHRQQRQLSKFLMRYLQFASHVYCGASFQDGVAAGKGFLCVCVCVCRVTQGAHIVGLRLTRKKLGQLPLLTVYAVPL